MFKIQMVSVVVLQVLVLWGCGWSEVPPVGYPSDIAADLAQKAQESVVPCARRLWVRGGPTQNIAHRGASMLAPENTLAAGEKARRVGADAWEFDIRPTADGKLVLMHDSSVLRTTDYAERQNKAAKYKGYVGEMLWAELRALHVGRWFAKSKGPALRKAREIEEDEEQSYNAQKLPSFASALQLTKEQDWCAFVDVKTHLGKPLQREIAQQIVKEILAYEMEGQVLVISFDVAALQLLRSLSSELRLGLLGDDWRSSDLSRVQSFHGQAYLPKARSVGHPQIDTTRNAKLSLYPWTSNESKEMERLVELGVGGIITDNPHILARILHKATTYRGNIQFADPQNKTPPRPITNPPRP